MRMKYRSAALLLALAFGAAGSAPFAQDEGEAAPPAPATGDEAPDMDSQAPTVVEDPVVKEEMIPQKGDVLDMPPAAGEPPPPLAMPYHGLSMSDVEQRYGAPLARHPAVGDPPITRWDYDGFSVFFENRTVLHSVQQGRPAEIYRKEELLPATAP
jgi:hypothetical protein